MKPFVFSIQTRHLDEFRSGRKGWEYRKRRPSIERGSRHLIYETAPVAMVVAVATIGRVLAKPPSQIWDLTGDRSGLSRQVFDSYFSRPCKVCRGRGVDPFRSSAGQSTGCGSCGGSGVAGPRRIAVAIEMRMEWLERPVPLPASMHPPQMWARWTGPWPLAGHIESAPPQLGLPLCRE